MEDLVITGAKLTEKSESDGKHSNSVPHNFHTMSIEKENSREDFEKYFSTPEGFADLTEKCLHADLDHVRCRWTAWRAFLGAFEVGDENKIREQVKKDREAYLKELDKYKNFRAKQKLDVEEDNPLSTSNKNPWNSFFEDNELKSEIIKDVERTYQDIDFFYTKETQDMLTNILFVWCKQNPDLSYRQGMNEIVGVLTIVCFTENFKAKNPETDLYDFLNDETCAEPDIYILFKKILSLNQKDMFRSSVPGDDDPKAKKKAAAKAGESQRPNLPVVNRAVRIQEEYLPRINKRLFAHLQKMSVEPQIYMIRWLRCMLSREFRVFQTLIVWDALFSFYSKTNPKPNNFEFLDYICVAMLMYVSTQLLERDDGGMILGRLIKYPPVESVKNMLALAHEKVLAPLKGQKAKPQAVSKPKSNFSLNENDESPTYKQEDKLTPQQGDSKIILFNSSTATKSTTSTSNALTSSRDSTRSNLSSESPNNPFTVKKTLQEDPLFGGTKNPALPIKKTVQNPFAASAKTQLGGDVISSYHIKAMEKGKPQSVQNVPEKIEKVEKKAPSISSMQKLEEGNTKALLTLKTAIELLKQEHDKNPLSNLGEVLGQLNSTIDTLTANSNEIQNLK